MAIAGNDSVPCDFDFCNNSLAISQYPLDNCPDTSVLHDYSFSGNVTLLYTSGSVRSNVSIAQDFILLPSSTLRLYVPPVSIHHTALRVGGCLISHGGTVLIDVNFEEYRRLIRVQGGSSLNVSVIESESDCLVGNLYFSVGLGYSFKDGFRCSLLRNEFMNSTVVVEIKCEELPIPVIPMDPLEAQKIPTSPVVVTYVFFFCLLVALQTGYIFHHYLMRRKK